MKKTYLQPTTEIVMTMPVRTYMIGASEAGTKITDIGDGGNSSDAGIGDDDLDTKGTIFDENPWEF